MPASDVSLSFPLVRVNPIYPGQLGVRGAWNELGLRTDPLGSVFYVNPNHPDCNDDADGTDPNQPLVTVAEALTRCESWHNDRIIVGHNDAWQYSPKVAGHNTPIIESVTVTVHGVSIVGAAPSASLGPVWHPATVTRIAITVLAMDVLIEGFCFRGCLTGAGGTAIYVDWDGVTKWGDNLTVRNCFFDDVLDIGIQADYAWYCDVHHNRFNCCDVAGIYQDPAMDPVEYWDIHDNEFHNVGIGETGAISISEAAHCHIYRNRIMNSNAQSGAASANEGINTSAGTGDNLVCDNYFSCLLPHAGNGDWDDLNSADAADAWVFNHCLNGENVTNPA